MSSSTSMPVLSKRLTTDPLGRTASFHSVGGSLSGSTYSVARRRAHSDSKVPLKFSTVPLKFPTVSLRSNTGTLKPITQYPLARSTAAWLIYIPPNPAGCTRGRSIRRSRSVGTTGGGVGTAAPAYVRIAVSQTLPGGSDNGTVEGAIGEGDGSSHGRRRPEWFGVHDIFPRSSASRHGLSRARSSSRHCRRSRKGVADCGGC